MLSAKRDPPLLANVRVVRLAESIDHAVLKTLRELEELAHLEVDEAALMEEYERLFDEAKETARPEEGRPSPSR